MIENIGIHDSWYLNVTWDIIGWLLLGGVDFDLYIFFFFFFFIEKKMVNSLIPGLIQ